MTTDAERTADTLLKVHREYAVFVAARRANTSFERGDAENFRAWAQVVKAIGERDLNRGMTTREHI